jgi:superoxide reductase
MDSERVKKSDVRNRKKSEVVMEPFGKLVYTPETAAGEAISKVESHTPKIAAPDSVKAGQPFELRVTVGPHPNTVEHSIRRIEVYFNEEGRSFNPVHLATTAFTPVYSEPKMTLSLQLSKPGTIYAVEYCNLHGLWEGRKEIKVTA